MSGDIEIINNAFGLFQFYFWQIITGFFPYLFIIAVAVILFYLLFKKK